MNVKIVVFVLFATNSASASRAKWPVRSVRSATLSQLSLSASNLADDCQCSLSDQCSCEGAMEFMRCIEAACNMDKCVCKQDDGADHYQGACNVVNGHCPTIGLQCQARNATCGGAEQQTVVPIKEHEEKIIERRTHGHHLFAMLFLSLFALITIAFAMTSSSNQTLVKNTWEVIDSIAVTSIALTLFYIFAHLFDDMAKFTGLSQIKILLHVVYAVVVFFIAVYGSYLLRNDKVGQASFMAIIYWMCLLGKSGALTTAQSELPAHLGDVCIVTGGSLVFFTVLMVITHKIKPEPGWYDTVETKLMGGAFASGVCQFMGILINGLDHGPHKSQNGLETLLTALFALFTCVCAVILTPPLSRIQKANEGYWRGRFLDFVDGFVGIMPYFTVSLGAGVVACNLLGVHPATMTAKLVHAMTNVTIGFVMIFACAFIPYLKRETEDVKNLAGLILGFGGYVAGYALAVLLTGAIDEVVEGRGYEGHGMFIAKTVIIACFNALLIPVYVIYLKPLVMKKLA